MGRGEGHAALNGAGAAGEPWRSQWLSLSGRTQLPREQVAEIQRSRLLAGALAAIEELGYEDATVGQITARAGVSRRTFYELFGDREACLLALLEDVIGMVEEEVAGEAPTGAGWRERVRGGLGAILAFLDREPALARVCVVQSLRGGPQVQELRGRTLARLAGAIDAGRGERVRRGEQTPLVAEGLVGAAFEILYARLLRGERRPLSALQGELMSLIVLPYLGPAAARRELSRPAGSTAPRAQHPPARPRSRRYRLQEIPLRLTLRTARALEAIAELPGACNREVAERAGIADPGQISKLLSRLQRLGLIENGSVGHARGEPNAWSLTAAGQQVTQSIRLHAGRETGGSAAR
jgi:AcrR family transcriptional regulator/DNA-binding MarR family transcriptional regulator